MHKAKMWAAYCVVMAISSACLLLPGCDSSKQMSFKSPDDASAAFAKALRENDKEKLQKILGPEGKQLIWSGDDVRDKMGQIKFAAAYETQHSIDAEGNRKILIIGEKQWPFPIPLIEEKGKWVFDTAAGKEEILNRRIGQNELDTIQTMLAIVDAQREYAMNFRDANGVGQYARKFKSDAGKRNGLYWDAKEGEPPSPLGPLVAQAKAEGYLSTKSSDKPQPYHGYFYHMLMAQGTHADGGAFEYIVNERMIGGFAVVAYPAEYGNSGIMTFIVNHDGIVYQKDLGTDTGQKVKTMTIFDPDDTWTKVK